MQARSSFIIENKSKPNKMKHQFRVLLGVMLLAISLCVSAQDNNELIDIKEKVDRMPKISGFVQGMYQADFNKDFKLDDNTFSMRRVRMSIEGNLTKSLTYKIQGDFLRKPMLVDAFVKYKVCNECRAKHTKHKELGKKPKSPHGTGERCEYHRQYWQRHKDEIKARRCENIDTSKAVVTDKRIVILYKKGYSPNDISSRCMVSIEHVRHVVENECRSGDARMCSECWLYPCFEGMDSICSNLALTCQKYHKKENAS